VRAPYDVTVDGVAELKTFVGIEHRRPAAR